MYPQGEGVFACSRDDGSEPSCRTGLHGPVCRIRNAVPHSTQHSTAISRLYPTRTLLNTGSSRPFGAPACHCLALFESTSLRDAHHSPIATPPMWSKLSADLLGKEAQEALTGALQKGKEAWSAIENSLDQAVDADVVPSEEDMLPISIPSLPPETGTCHLPCPPPRRSRQPPGATKSKRMTG